MLSVDACRKATSSSTQCCSVGADCLAKPAMLVPVAFSSTAARRLPWKREAARLTKVSDKPKASAFLPGIMHGIGNPIRMGFKLYHTSLIQDSLRDASFIMKKSLHEAQEAKTMETMTWLRPCWHMRHTGAGLVSWASPVVGMRYFFPSPWSRSAICRDCSGSPSSKHDEKQTLRCCCRAARAACGARGSSRS